MLGEDPRARRARLARADRHRPAELPPRSLPDRARVARALRRLLPRAAPGRRGDRAGRPRAARPTTRAGKLSGGQQRRLDVGMALVGDPELLFLDEPTTGFDPSARRQAWEVIAGLRDLGKTVFLTTHYMDEAQRLADRVAIIAARRDRRPRARPRTSATARASRRRSCLPRSTASEVSGSRPTTPVADAQRADRLGAGRGRRARGPRGRRPSLEDIYLELTAEAERAA